jgi:cell wall-associated NlpC family hydrolase
VKVVAPLALAVATLVLGLPLLAVVVLFGGPGGSAPSAASDDGSAVAAIPAGALADYQAAALTCPGLSWTVLAAIGEVESDHGRSTLPGVQSGANAAGAEGPMQILPATFAEYAPPGANPYEMADATTAAAAMLCADGGRDPATLSNAIWAYNHSVSYVDEVLAWASAYAGGVSGDGGAAAMWAARQVGLPYLWGAAGPSAFDCSGLTLRAWQSAGVNLPRVAADQYNAGVHVPVAAAQPGDLVFYAPDPSDPATIDHVAIYLGDGLMVEAPHTGADVRIVGVYPDGLVPLVTRP